MNGQPVLETRGVGLRIGGARILRDISLSIQTGEMLGVIGPNGAGKTSLFNVISGVRSATEGSVHLDGRDITRDPIHTRARAGLGRTFQTSSMFNGLSASENVRIAAQIQAGGATRVTRFPRSSDEANRIARERLTEVGLADLRHALAGGLSHGDKRKLEIAMLLAMEPRVLLLDEPMAGVGSGDVSGLMDVIRGLHKGGRTVLMVEHHMEVVMGLVDRVAVLHHGELLACDTPQNVMADENVQSAYLGATA